jgi:hypothetical protein
MIVIPVLLVVASLSCSVFVGRLRHETRTVDDRYELALAARIAGIKERSECVAGSLDGEPRIARRLAEEDLPALVRVVGLLLEERDQLNRVAKRLWSMGAADDADLRVLGRREGHALASMSAARVIDEVLAEAFNLWGAYRARDDDRGRPDDGS